MRVLCVKSFTNYGKPDMIRLTKDDILGVECKNISYQAAVDRSLNDMLLVKEVVHTKDGRHIHRIRQIENFKRPFYITRENYRNHQDKKEYEDLEKLHKYECTQVELPLKIQQALGRTYPDAKKQLRDVCQNPYVYYADMSPAALLKHRYKEKWPNLVSRSRVAVLDTERDVVFGTNETILTSVTMGTTRIVGVVKWWADRIPDFEKTIHDKYHEYLSDIVVKRAKKNPENGKIENVPTRVNLIEERGGDIEIHICENAGQAIAAVMKRTHELMPDFLAIWNMNYDIPQILAALQAAGIRAEDVFCDPSVPEIYRKVRYKEAKAQRETNSKTISQHPADLWHVLYCMAGFYVVDAMCLFKKIRVAKGNEPDYNLDGVLHRHLGIGKLKFKEADHLKRLKWHVFMQKNYPAEYVIYNLFDCISIELLDEKTNDLGMTMSSLADISEYAIFPSLPKRLVDILHFFYEERGKIAGCVGSDITSVLDDDVIDMTGWIVTLPAYAVEDNGLCCIKEVPEQRTMFRRQTIDADILQAYPSGEVVLNISKETTFIEVCSIDGVSEDARRRAGINLTGGMTNAIEICNDILNMPYIDDVLDAFREDIAAGRV